MSVSNSSPLFWTLREIARLERSSFRPPRLTEPGMERWARIRRKLGWVAFIDLLHEDLATTFPTAFALERWAGHPTAKLTEEDARAVLDGALAPGDSDTNLFLKQVTRGLELMDGGNISSLPKVQPHQRALELPGCGGRLAAYQVSNHAGLSFHEHFTFVADDDKERVAIGIAAAELRANPPLVLTRAELMAKKARFDHVFGIKGYSDVDALVADLKLEVRWA